MTATRFVGCVAALLVLAASACGGSPEPQATATPVGTPSPSVGANETPAPTTPTATPTVAGPTPTATPIALPSTVAGKPVIQLRPGAPVEFPDDLVMYLGTSRCTQCSGWTGDSFWRIYRGHDGQLVADHIQPENGATFYAVSADASTIFAGVCTDYCGGEAPPSATSTMRFVVSRDGGITWQPLPSPTFERTEFLGGGWFGDQVVATAVRYMEGDEVARVDSYLIPSFTRLEPPPGLPAASFKDYQFPVLRVAPGGQLVWSMRQASGPDLLFDEQGGATSFGAFEALLAGTSWSLGGLDTTAAFGIWKGSLHRYDRSFLVMVDGEGTPLAGFAADVPVIDANGVSEGRFLAAAVLPLATGESQPPGGDNFRAVLVDTATGVMHPIKGLPRDESPLPGEYSWPQLGVTGKFWRVEAGDSCLNVRQEPSVASPTLGCFASGVLLREREAEAAAGWQAVATPDGRPGFAASQYLR